MSLKKNIKNSIKCSYYDNLISYHYTLSQFLEITNYNKLNWFFLSSNPSIFTL